MNTPPDITLEGDTAVAAVIGLGSNLHSEFGTPLETLGQAWRLLREISVQAAQLSPFYVSEPVDCEPGTPKFVNAVAIIHLPRQQSAERLLRRLHEIESAFGRRRQAGLNRSRILDLDLLCFGSERRSGAGLTLPHARAHQRRFVLAPLADLAPDLLLPGQSVPVRQLLSDLPPGQAVTQISSPGSQ